MEESPSERALDALGATLEFPSEQRTAFLAQLCADDPALGVEVRALLAHESQARGFLEAPVVRPAATGPEEKTTALQPGDVLGDYEVVRLLGEGGMGEVYLAQDRKLGRPVALKLLKSHLAAESMQRRFLHERKVLAALTHPNIARLYGGSVAGDGRTFLVMEYVDGERLDRYCDAHQLGIEERLALFRKVCAAVTHAHQNLVIHRDLKPANILVTADGEPKLLDFGIAKLVENDTGAGDAMTVTMFAAMTPEYASPEQLRGDSISTVSDVYSLGVILYALLTGRRPHQTNSRNPSQLVRVVTEEESTRPSLIAGQAKDDDTRRVAGLSPARLRQRLTGDIDNILSKALRIDPARRYGSVAQFSEDLRRHGAGLPITARPDTFSYRAGKFIRRNKLGVALAALTALALVVGLIATLWEAHRAARRFEDVRHLANSLLFEIEPQMAAIPGTTPVRSLVARRALEYLDSLSTEAGSNWDLRRELASGYERVGDVQGNPAGANLGDLKGALASYAKARAIRQDLATQAPHNPWARHELANNLEQTGTILWSNSDTPGALAQYRTALALRRALLAAQPGNADFRRGFGSVLMRLADIDTWNGDNDAAKRDLGEALPVLQSLHAEDPGNSLAQLDFARCLSRLGVARREAGDIPGGLDALHQAEAIMERHLQLHPDDRPSILQYAFELLMETESYQALGTPDANVQALAVAPRAVKLLESVAARDPRDVTIQQDFSVACRDLGVSLVRAEKYSEALEALNKAQATIGRLAAEAPGNGDYQYNIAGIYDRLSEAYLGSHRFDEAAAAAQHGLQSLRECIKADAENTQAKREMVFALILSGRAQTGLEQPVEARTLYQQALDGLETLHARHYVASEDDENLAFLHKALQAPTASSDPKP